MNKLLFGAAVSAAMFGGVAHAAITVDANGIPVIKTSDTYEVYLSGSSAAATFLEQLLLNPKIPSASRICDSSKLIYKFQDTATGKDYKAYYCVLNTKNTAISGLAAGKTNLLLYKRDNGGSAQGVTPIAADAAIDFLKVDTAANCAVKSAGVIGSTFTSINCTFTAGNASFSNSHIPDFGIADVDPIQFQGDNTPAGFSAITAADVAKLTIKPASAQVFGIVVTTKLRNALQEAQFGTTNVCVTDSTKAEKVECMPSLNSAQIASIFTGKISSWSQFKRADGGNLFSKVTAANAPASDRLHICRRTSGSGTQAQFGINFLGYPCNDAASAPVTDTGTTPETIAAAQVHAMSSAGTLNECLTELNRGDNTVGTAFNNTYTGVRWAIGIQGTELNKDLSSDFRFIKIDGIEPTLDKVVKGKYKDWVELTFQYNKTHAFDPSEQALIDEIIKEAGNPLVMAATNSAAAQTWGQAGFLATPQSYNPQTNGTLSTAKPVNPFSHGTTSAAIDNCRMPAAYDLGTTRGLQVK